MKTALYTLSCDGCKKIVESKFADGKGDYGRNDFEGWYGINTKDEYLIHHICGLICLANLPDLPTKFIVYEL